MLVGLLNDAMYLKQRNNEIALYYYLNAKKTLIRPFTI